MSVSRIWPIGHQYESDTEWSLKLNTVGGEASCVLQTVPFVMLKNWKHILILSDILT